MLCVLKRTIAELPPSVRRWDDVQSERISPPAANTRIHHSLWPPAAAHLCADSHPFQRPGEHISRPAAALLSFHLLLAFSITFPWFLAEKSSIIYYIIYMRSFPVKITNIWPFAPVLPVSLLPASETWIRPWMSGVPFRVGRFVRMEAPLRCVSLQQLHNCSSHALVLPFRIVAFSANAGKEETDPNDPLAATQHPVGSVCCLSRRSRVQEKHK